MFDFQLVFFSNIYLLAFIVPVKLLYHHLDQIYCKIMWTFIYLAVYTFIIIIIILLMCMYVSVCLSVCMHARACGRSNHGS